MWHALLEARKFLRENNFAVMQSLEGWNSKFVDYHHPFVKRLWRQWGEYRIYLHEVYPVCDEADSLYHPHPWPSIVQILQGEYAMRIGVKSAYATVYLLEGSHYEMLNKQIWHSVAPTDSKSVFSLMVTGKPWDLELEPLRNKLSLKPMPLEEQDTLRARFLQIMQRTL